MRQLREMWEHKTGEFLGPGWNAAFADWIKKFGFPLAEDALQMASIAGFSEDGERLPPNIRDVPKYAAVEQAEAKEPGMRQCYFVRGRMRNKFYCMEDDNEILSLLRRAMRSGVSPSAMHQAVDESETLEDCFAALGIDRFEFRVAMGHPIVDQPVRQMVFISADEPEWRLWDDHLRKKTGKGPPMNRRGGWYFPTRVPPTDEGPKRRSRPRTGRDW